MRNHENATIYTQCLHTNLSTHGIWWISMGFSLCKQTEKQQMQNQVALEVRSWRLALYSL